MSPLQKTSWHPLDLTTPLRSAPPLLIQSTFTPTSYTIHLTDLTTVWSESLTKREILRRAEQECTSIDPSEDTSQLQILLEKLQSAIGRDTTADDVEIVGGPAGGLKLKTRTRLPSPLKDLKWGFDLSVVKGVALANLFILPLLAEVAVVRDMVESLLGVVREKDGVLERLTEAMHEAGMDVKNVIGGGRRRRGLEKFQKEKWKGEFVSGDRRVGEVIAEVFGEARGEAPGVKGLGGEAGEWWRGLEGLEEAPRPVLGRKAAASKSKEPEKAVKTESESEGEGVFEAQKTPPRPLAQTKKPPPPPSPPPHQAQDETESDDDLDLPPPRKPPIPTKSKSPSAVPPSPVKKGIGKIGGRKKPSPPPVQDVQMEDAEETADEDEPPVADKGKGKAEPTDTEDDDEMPVPPMPPAKKGVKTVIGGEKKPTPESAVEEKAAPIKKIGKIGKIGGKKAAPVVDNAGMKDEPASPALRSLSRIPSPPPPVAVKAEPEPEPEPEPEEEDEDTKAGRRRRQLEKDLEAKKKAPVKKKRKF